MKKNNLIAVIVVCALLAAILLWKSGLFTKKKSVPGTQEEDPSAGGSSGFSPVPDPVPAPVPGSFSFEAVPSGETKPTVAVVVSGGKIPRFGTPLEDNGNRLVNPNKKKR